MVRLHYSHLTSITISWRTMSTSSVMSVRRPYKNQNHLLRMFLLVLGFVEYYNRICEHKYLLCKAILHPSKSPWQHLFDNGDESSFLLMTGLTRAAFIELHDILKPPGYHYLTRKTGRKWSLPSDAQLGLLLFYMCSTMNYKHLCLIFGITPSVCSQILTNTIKPAVRRLSVHDSTKVKFSSPEKMQ